MEQITVCVTTIDWSFGNNGHFQIAVKRGCKATICWGDGCVKQITGKGVLEYYDHEYKKKKEDQSFIMRITADEKDAITEYAHGFIDMHTNRIDMSLCPGIKRFFAGINDDTALDVSGCAKLEEFSCSWFSGSLDLSACVNLNYLELRAAKIPLLDLRMCCKLRTMNIMLSEIKSILLTNDSPLSEMTTDNESLDVLKPKCKMAIMRIIENNNGTLKCK